MTSVVVRILSIDHVGETRYLFDNIYSRVGNVTVGGKKKPLKQPKKAKGEDEDVR